VNAQPGPLAAALASARAALDAVDAFRADYPPGSSPGAHLHDHADYMTRRGDVGMGASFALRRLLSVIGRQGAVLADLDVLGQALDDAVTYRNSAGSCTACDDSPAELCQDHAADIDKVDAYLALAGSLGIEVDR